MRGPLVVLGLDIKMLLKTLWVVLITREGMYREDWVNDLLLSRCGSTWRDIAQFPRWREIDLVYRAGCKAVTRNEWGVTSAECRN